jgi:hypothetical protein
MDITFSPSHSMGSIPSRLAFQPEHGRHAGAMDIHVQQSHPLPSEQQGDGQIHSHRAFAHAPLSRHDDDLVLDAAEMGLQLAAILERSIALPLVGLGSGTGDVMASTASALAATRPTFLWSVF